MSTIEMKKIKTFLRQPGTSEHKLGIGRQIGREWGKFTGCAHSIVVVQKKKKKKTTFQQKTNSLVFNENYFSDPQLSPPLTLKAAEGGVWTCQLHCPDEMLWPSTCGCFKTMSLSLREMCTQVFIQGSDLVSGMCFKIPQERKMWAGRGWGRGDDVWVILLKPGDRSTRFMVPFTLVFEISHNN